MGGAKMVTLDQVQTALKKVGMHNRFWGKAEMRELCNILTPDETIIGAVNVRYEGGFAMLLATDRRLLLVDKKVMFLNMEDIRYDMISQLEFSARLLDATLTVKTINTVLRFTAYKQQDLRKLTNFMQERVMELRHMYEQQGNVQPANAASLTRAQQPTMPQYSQAPTFTQIAEPPAPVQTFAQRIPNPYPHQGPLMTRRRVSRFYPARNYR